MIYRSAEEATRRRRDELLQRRQLEVATLPEAVPAVYVRRRARLMAGAAGIACAVFMAVCAAFRREGLTTILHGSWICMLGVYLFTREAARHHVRRVLARAFSPSESPISDVDRLEELTPAAVVRELAARLEWRSVALPMTALALLLPLSLHYLVVAMLHAGVPHGRDFDGWISLSLLFVGHCHVVLAYQAWRFARRLREAEDVFTVGLIADRSGWQAWGVTIASSIAAGVLLLVVVPIAGIALVIVAPAVVAATGLAFIPTMFSRMGRKVREERLLLAYPDRNAHAAA
jgi:hypothetical protein